MDSTGWLAAKWLAAKWVAAKWVAAKWVAAKWVAAKWQISFQMAYPQVVSDIESVLTLEERSFGKKRFEHCRN